MGDGEVVTRAFSPCGSARRGSFHIPGSDRALRGGRSRIGRNAPFRRRRDLVAENRSQRWAGDRSSGSQTSSGRKCASWPSDSSVASAMTQRRYFLTPFLYPRFYGLPFRYLCLFASIVAGSPCHHSPPPSSSAGARMSLGLKSGGNDSLRSQDWTGSRPLTYMR